MCSFSWYCIFIFIFMILYMVCLTVWEVNPWPLRSMLKSLNRPIRNSATKQTSVESYRCCLPVDRWPLKLFVTKINLIIIWMRLREPFTRWAVRKIWCYTTTIESDSDAHSWVGSAECSYTGGNKWFHIWNSGPHIRFPFRLNVCSNIEKLPFHSEYVW